MTYCYIFCTCGENVGKNRANKKAKYLINKHLAFFLVPRPATGEGGIRPTTPTGSRPNVHARTADALRPDAGATRRLRRPAVFGADAALAERRGGHLRRPAGRRHATADSTRPFGCALPDQMRGFCNIRITSDTA